MFFEASQFGCRKTIFDATKVTYDTYSCVISGMSREMMKMDGRDSAECQNWGKKDIDGIIGFDLNDNNAKIVNSIISYKLKMSQNVKKKTGEMQKFENGVFRERLPDFSLSFQ